jgi:uncharacterized protein
MEILDFRVRPRTEWFYRNLVPKPIPEFERYCTLYHGHPRFGIASFEQSILDMAEFGITKGLIFADDAPGNQIVAETCEKHEAYVGLAAARPDHGITQAVRDLRHAFENLGLRGLNINPYITGLYATNEKNYPLYALCDELGRCIVSHTSVHYNPLKCIDFGDPRYIDQVAVDFPDLTIVMAHAGYGFGDLGLMVANRHENVYVDFTGLHPRILPKETIRMINGHLRRKSIFGTNYPCLDYNVVEEWKKVIDEKNQPNFFYKNAAHVLGIE